MKIVNILGNGRSRLEVTPGWYEEGKVWVCNYGFAEFGVLPPIDTIGTVHEDVVHAAKVARFYLRDRGMKAVSGRWRIVVPKDRHITMEGIEQIECFHPISTGPFLVHLALAEGYEKVRCFGFDFGGGSIYGGYTSEGVPIPAQYPDWWREQMQRIYQKFQPTDDQLEFRQGWEDTTIETRESIMAWRSK